MSERTNPFAIVKKWGVGESLALRRPNRRFVQLTLLVLISYFVIGEIVFRTSFVQSKLIGPRIGSQHHQFEIQLGRLEKLVKEGEPIDCIFLGNSMVWLGINPLVVDQVFQSGTGQGIHCFNFGVSALPASSAGLIAPMLVEKFHPKLLIYGTFARDYAVPADAEDAYVVSSTPWLKYENGEFSLEGWLYDHSSVFQYKGHLRDFMYMNFEEVFVQDNTPDYQAYGLDPKYDIRLNVDESPDFKALANRDPVKWLGHYEIRQENLEGLRQIVQQSNQGVKVIVIEMPFYKTALDFFPNGEGDYETYVQQVDQITASNGTSFWRINDQPALSPENWWDYFHLNLRGVDLFSEWIGNQLVNTYLQGNLNLSASVNP